MPSADTPIASLKSGNLKIAVITGVLIIALFSGCISEETAVPAADTLPVTPQVVPAAVHRETTITPVPTTPGCAYPPLNLWTGIPESYSHAGITKLPPEVGALVSQADLFGTPSLSWKAYTSTMQYRRNAGGELVKSKSTWRQEIAKEDVQGKLAIHAKDTTTFSTSEPVVSPEQLTVTETWYDEGHVMVSQHRKVSINDDVGEARDIPVKNPEPDCSGELFSPKYVYEGVDPVTVPAGSFPDAMKYTAKYGTTGTISFWFASGVPVEVKKVIVDPKKEELDTIELAGWG